MRKYRWLAGLLAAVWLCLLPAGALANGAEPPHVTILVQNGPKDLRLALRISDGEKVVEEDLESVPLLWEQYFQWYGSLTRWTLENWYHMGPAASQTLLVQWEGVYLEIPLDGVEPVGHSNMVTLDVAAGTLTPGEPFWRIPLKIGARIAATLLIEGLVFWLFRRLFSGQGASAEPLRLTIAHQGRQAELFAKADTGNALREPFSGLPVIVCAAEAGAGLRLVPFQTLGGDGLLPAFKPDRVVAAKTGQELECYLALSAKPLSAGQFSAIYNPELFPKE